VKVIARSNRGQELPELERAELGYPAHIVLPITKGQEYGVLSMALMAPFLDFDYFGLMYLILRDHGLPGWVPGSLFEESDPRLSNHWRFERFPPRSDSPWRGLWGYDSMINDRSHNDSLIELEESAQRVFLSEVDRSCLAGRDEEHLLNLARSLNL